MRDISLDLVRVTEAGAIAASKHIGSGDKLLIDKDATYIMRNRFDGMSFNGKIVIGEGQKDKSYGLFEGETVGLFKGDDTKKQYDIAIDPVDGTTPTANAGPEAISTIAVAKQGCMFTTDSYYMLKVAVGPTLSRLMKAQAKSCRGDYHRLLHRPLTNLIETTSKLLNKPTNKITVCMLNRPRHDEYMFQLRQLGCRIKLIDDCDVGGAIAACLPGTGIDIYYGIGGAPEAILAAAAIKCLGGEFEAQECVDAFKRCEEGSIWDTGSLVKGPCVFCATGITDGSLLDGVKVEEWGRYKTHSVFMRSESGTVRWIKAWHGN